MIIHITCIYIMCMRECMLLCCYDGTMYDLAFNAILNYRKPIRNLTFWHKLIKHMYDNFRNADYFWVDTKILEYERVLLFADSTFRKEMSLLRKVRKQDLFVNWNTYGHLGVRIFFYVYVLSHVWRLLCILCSIDAMLNIYKSVLLSRWHAFY